MKKKGTEKISDLMYNSIDIQKNFNVFLGRII